MGQRISYDQHGGGKAEGYLAEPARAAPAAPGMVVIQEWWGLVGQIQQACDRLAQEGFRALAPDLYGGKTVPYHDAGAAQKMMQTLDFQKSTAQAVRGAAQRLAEGGGKVGIVGFCMGGVVAVLGAALIPELTSAVTFYGLPPPGVPIGPAEVKVPLQGHFAAQDDFCTPELVDRFEASMNLLGKPHEFHRYPGHHAFMNSDRKEVYDGTAAAQAWTRCVEWCRRTLG